MKRLTGGKIVCAVLITATLLGAASPKDLRQMAEQKNLLRKDLALMSRCGRAQIRYGVIPPALFNQCAETYQKLGLTLFPDNNQSSSSSENANGYGASSGSSSSASSVPPVTSSSTSSVSSIAASSVSSIVAPTATPTPIPPVMMTPSSTATSIATAMPTMTYSAPLATSTSRPVWTFSNGTGGQNQPLA